MRVKKRLEEDLKIILKKYLPEGADTDFDLNLILPTKQDFGDYTTNFAMQAFKIKWIKKDDDSRVGKRENPVSAGSPVEFANRIKADFENFDDGKLPSYLKQVDVLGPGFINFWINEKDIFDELNKDVLSQDFCGRKLPERIMVEYAHPNTHKEMHIGHMRTLVTGESLARIFDVCGAKVFRANYQGDIGPHVAKAIYGISVLMDEKKLSLDEVEKWSNKDKAHFLGEGYVKGSLDYEGNKEEIDDLNTRLYKKDPSVEGIYKTTRKWSIDYYQDFYIRFYTKFDRLFFESEMVELGKKIVMDNLDKVFVKENGAVIFPGEKHGLHTRVFITKDGNPTYEGKEMGSALSEYEAFNFDLKMHIVASEQAGYFQVVFKALDLIDPEKFKDKQHHLSMGMVTLTDRKMSSRTGDILTVDWLIDQVKERVKVFAEEGKITKQKDSKESDSDFEKIIEQITIGAIKYSVLKGGATQNVAFDIEKSVSLDGNSGPYLQYTHARTQSVIGKWGSLATNEENKQLSGLDFSMEKTEKDLLRKLYQFDEVVLSAAYEYSPSNIATYLFDLAQDFNHFYQKYKIIGGEKEVFRIFITRKTGDVIRRGLYLLGIEVPNKM